MADPITIVDLAKELNISASTVSRALRDHPGIKDETKRSVRKLAEKLGYQPNTLALSLLYKKTNNIGIIVPEITSYFFSSIICGIQDMLDPLGLHAIISQSNESPEAEKKGLETLLSSRVDGLLISTAFNTRDFSHFEKPCQNNIPLVVFDRDNEKILADKVLVDDYDGACQAVEHLIHQGCKRIAHISGPPNLSITQHRKDGYIDTLNNHGIAIDDKLIIQSSLFKMEDGIEPAKYLLDLEDRPDGIFAINDGIAIGALSVLRERNVKVPQDMAIIGFDNDPFSSFSFPTLSTIDQPTYEIGMLAARI
ncbi:MAG: LacI family transcriptional regulator, partial [Cyclobacteriaceae bacterium]|nr:LacI family transcriptional regulator [Cyclobacteriaceae bacterium]